MHTAPRMAACACMACQSPFTHAIVRAFSLISPFPLLQNWFYSLSRFGKVNEVLVATFDEASLTACLTLGFVCFDGTTFFPEDPKHRAEAGYGDEEWLRVSG